MSCVFDVLIWQYGFKELNYHKTYVAMLSVLDYRTGAQFHNACKGMLSSYVKVRTCV